MVAASRKVEFGCVVAAAGAPGASDREMYQDMVTDCAQYSELGFGTMWVLEHHFSDYFPAPDPAVQWGTWRAGSPSWASAPA